MDEGMIVVDPHAFEDLWPALGLWLVLFLSAGDAVTVVPRAATLALGEPAQAVVVDKTRHGRRDYASFIVDGVRHSEPIDGRGFKLIAKGQKRAAHRFRHWAFLDEDYGYARFKLWLFGASFAALWLWAAARYRFG